MSKHLIIELTDKDCSRLLEDLKYTLERTGKRTDLRTSIWELMLILDGVNHD